MGDEIIEGFNTFIDKERKKYNINSSSYLVLRKVTGNSGFGGYSNISWQVWNVFENKKDNIILKEVTVRARPKMDDYVRELSIKLSEALFEVCSDPKSIEDILYGK